MSVIPRLRMFAGPNGAGKSTLNNVLGPALLGVYINPDEIEKQILQGDCLDFIVPTLRVGTQPRTL